MPSAIILAGAPAAALPAVLHAVRIDPVTILRPDAPRGREVRFHFKQAVTE